MQPRRLEFGDRPVPLLLANVRVEDHDRVYQREGVTRILASPSLRSTAAI
jgi:hypothetical protein